MDFIPGWELQASWDVDHYTGNLPPGVPRDGHLCVTFSTTHANHIPNPKTRQWILENRVLLAIEPMQLEGRIQYLL